MGIGHVPLVRGLAKSGVNQSQRLDVIYVILITSQTTLLKVGERKRKDRSNEIKCNLKANAREKEKTLMSGGKDRKKNVCSYLSSIIRLMGHIFH